MILWVRRRRDEHAGYIRWHQRAGLIGNAIAREHIESDRVLAEVFSDVGVTLHVGVVEYGGVVAGRSVVDTAGQRAETRYGIDRHDVLRSAFAEHCADAGRLRGFSDSALTQIRHR